MNSPALLQPAADPQLAASREDITYARQTLQRTLTFVREQTSPWPASGQARAIDDPYILSRFGDLNIRIDVAQALLERAEGTHQTSQAANLAAIETSIASADAVLVAGNLQQELTGARDAQPNARARLSRPLRWKYQALGNYRLNGVVPPLPEEHPDAS